MGGSTPKERFNDWMVATICYAHAATGLHDIAEVADRCGETAEAIWKGVQGNRPCSSVVSEADMRLLIESTLRRCIEVIERAVV